MHRYTNRTYRLPTILMGVLITLLTSPWHANAVSVTVNEIICDQAATPGCGGLDGTVDVTQLDAMRLQWH